jgi:hypothetical protein
MKTFIILISTITLAAAQWPPPKAPAVSGADGYVEIPNAALAPTKTSNYRAIFDATRPADKPTELLPALNMAGSELNALAAANVPMTDARFAVVFHGPAVDGILDQAHYNAKFGTSNPNVKAIAEMKRRGWSFLCAASIWQLRRLSRKPSCPRSPWRRTRCWF